jgi:hypothetical protein
MCVTALWWSYPYVDKPLVSLVVASLRALAHIESGGSKCELG